MNQIDARIILDSVSPAGGRLTTFEVQMPMHAWVHLLTHRALSRNLSSMRALSTEAVIKRASYTPEFWGANKPGMSPGSKQVSPAARFILRRLWESARRTAIMFAWIFCKLGLHKETANRILTPFILVRGLVSSTEWDNFYELRTDAHAQYEIRKLAVIMKEAQKNSIPVERKVHAPFAQFEVADEYIDYLFSTDPDSPYMDDLFNSSAARCARVSYMKHGVNDLEADLRLAKRLWDNKHMSPFEHVAIAAPDKTRPSGNYRGWIQMREFYA